MTSDSPQEATVYIHLPDHGYVPAGILEYLPAQGSSVFTYGRRYVLRPNAIPIDPVRLPLSFAGHARSPRRIPMFNALRDAAPDRWGRKVLTLRAGQAARTLSEFHILTAMHSSHRIGALAFGPNPHSGPQSMAPWAGDGDIFARSLDRLREMTRIIRFVAETPEADLDALRDRLPEDALLRAFTSLFSVGGARPKALVDIDGQAWIAKFPKADDVWNEPLIEHAAMTLATRCGVHAAQTKLLDLDGMQVLLVKRFDRDILGAPRHFVSGFTLMDVPEDGDWGGYQDLALAARRLGDPDAARQIFRRMAFNAICANTDDHPRNHGFFVDRTKVAITPAFDVVPRQFRSSAYHLALRCGVFGHQAGIRNLLSQTEPFGLEPTKARRILDEMLETASGWRGHFRDAGVTAKDILELEHRFLLVK